MQRNIKSRGFTIVELLIVIVIIGILATIVIVAYNGVTAKANTAAAQSAAQAAISKIEIYNAVQGQYPDTFAKFTTSATSADTFQLTGVTFTTTELSGTTPPTASQDGNGKTIPSMIQYYVCTTNDKGVGVKYYDFGAKAWVPMPTGGANSTLSTTGSPAPCSYQAS